MLIDNKKGEYVKIQDIIDMLEGMRKEITPGTGFWEKSMTLHLDIAINKIKETNENAKHEIECTCNSYGQKAKCTKCGGIIEGWQYGTHSPININDYR